MSGPITTHVLDLASGRPAVGVAVTLERRSGDSWTMVGNGKTDPDGRLKTLHPTGQAEPGDYRLTFDAGAYFKLRGTTTFYAHIPIEFHVARGSTHDHVPLLLSPFGYSTYRGS